MRVIPWRTLACALAVAMIALAAGQSGVASATAPDGTAAPEPAAAVTPRVEFHKWTTLADFQAGTGAGITELGARDGIQISGTVGTISYRDQ